MIVYKSFVYELDPSPEQRRQFVRYCGTARWAYNWALGRIKEVMDAGKGLPVDQRQKIPSAFDLQHEMVLLKKTEELSWLREPSKWVPACAIENCREALNRFFAGLKSGKRVGFPKFKSRHCGLGAFTIKESKVVQYRDGDVRLSKLGWVRIKGHNRSPEGRILKAIVREKAGRWFVSIQCEVEISVPENQGPVIGIDLGLATLATGSDGREWANARHLKKAMRLLKIRQRRLSRTEKGSKRRARAKLVVAKIHAKIANRRSDTIHKLTSELARNHSQVGIEDLNVKGMMANHSLARSISDASFGEFSRQMKYKCEWYGSKLVVHPRFFPSTKTCSGCGAIKKSMLFSERVYKCEHCGLEIGRDLNAARNLVPCRDSPRG